MPVTVSSELEGTCALHPVKASQYAAREKRPATAMRGTDLHPSATAFRCGLERCDDVVREWDAVWQLPFVAD